MTEAKRSDDKASYDEPVTTRVCIKNVPIKFTEQKLTEHLCSSIKDTLVVTDCRILKTKDGRSRKLAFVGFKTPEMAHAVIKRLHNTYAQTSKLSIEAAFSKKSDQEEKQQHRPWSKHSVGSSRYEEAKKKAEKNEQDADPDKNVKSTKQKKKTNDTDEPDHVQKRKQEFLAAMGISTESSTKRKFWSNDDGVEVNEKQEEDTAESSSDDESDSDTVMSDADSVDSGGEGADVMLSTSKAKKKPAGAVMSDLDFLRSKKTSVDDLTDEEEDVDGDAPGVNQKDNREESSDSSTSSSSSDSSSGDDNSEVDTKENQEKERAKSNDSGDDEEEEQKDSDAVAPNRLFVRNLPFASTEEELRELFSSFGTVLECHIPVDDQKRNKGFAFVTLDSSDTASRARYRLDGADFQGRLLHILPARHGPIADDVMNDPNLTYKQKMELQRKKDAQNSTQGANASFVRGDAVIDNLSERLGLKKGDILNVKDGLTSGDAAVRLALGETHIIEENRKYFLEHGIDMEALVSAKGEQNASNKRSSSSILVKNLPFDTAHEDLTKLFHGVKGDPPVRILLPPSRTIALVDYSHSVDARRAFKKLAYKRFKHVPLYLEWAPVSAATGDSKKSLDRVEHAEKSRSSESNVDQKDDEEDDAVNTAASGVSHTIYIKNLNFSTTEDRLQTVFSKHVSKVLAVKIPQKVVPLQKSDASETTRTLSMGFGFVECDSEASMRKAIKALQGTVVDGHALELKRSTKIVAEKKSTGTTPANTKNTKLMVRNVPFQATRKEILKLFGSFGQLKKVRLPKKFDGTHRGFAFVEFLTAQEALSAMNALSRTHLYGRHLVLEWASDKDDLDTLREKAKRDIVASEKPKNKKIRFE